jgi:hypothetical protein
MLVIISLIGYRFPNQKSGYQCYTQYSNSYEYLSFNSQTCSNSSQCLSPMVCNTINGSSCSCPTFVSTNKCDSPVRVSGFEYYSNGYTCVSALTYGNPCISNYSCQYLTQNSICRNGICSCPSLKYFNTIQKNCTNQQLINQPCSLSTDCRSDLGLICDSGLCECDSSIQYWFGSS